MNRSHHCLLSLVSLFLIKGSSLFCPLLLPVLLGLGSLVDGFSSIRSTTSSRSNYSYYFHVHDQRNKRLSKLQTKNVLFSKLQNQQQQQQQQHNIEEQYTTSVSSIDNITIEEATNILSNYDIRQQTFIKSDNSQGMGGGTSALTFIQTQLSKSDREQLRSALVTLTKEGQKQRDDSSKSNSNNTSQQQGEQQQYGRVMLGICAENVSEGLMGLKTWVEALSLPRGLLHGLDVDGKPIDPESLGSVYFKYNTGGCMTFAEMRKSGRGFDALWKPGDVVVETYDGDFRGIYYNVELEDGIFRQFGVLPTDLFFIDEGDDW